MLHTSWACGCKRIQLEDHAPSLFHSSIHSSARSQFVHTDLYSPHNYLYTVCLYTVCGRLAFKIKFCLKIKIIIMYFSFKSSREVFCNVLLPLHNSVCFLSFTKHTHSYPSYDLEISISKSLSDLVLHFHKDGGSVRHKH